MNQSILKRYPHVISVCWFSAILKLEDFFKVSIRMLEESPGKIFNVQNIFCTFRKRQHEISTTLFRWFWNYRRFQPQPSAKY